MKRWWWAGLILAGLVFWWRKQTALLSPLGRSARVETEKKDDYRVVGFLPGWMVGRTIDYCEQIDEMVFLGLGVDEEGGLVWDSQAKKIESGNFIRLAEGLEKCGGRKVLGIKMFEDNKITTFINSIEAREKLIGELREVVKERGFGGVNIDFEYQGSPLAVLDDDFIGFVRQISESGLGEISVDVFANTVIKGGERVENLLNEVDYLVVMAYDFCGPGSQRAGPVAPMSSEGRDIREIVGRIVGASLDRDKIVIAYPLYGYEWKTASEDFGARVKKGWWALASFGRMREVGRKVNWDEESMTPWLIYEEKGEIRQIYFENLESLGLKLELVKEFGLGGVGFWALGYEGRGEEVWELVREKLD